MSEIRDAERKEILLLAREVCKLALKEVGKNHDEGAKAEAYVVRDHPYLQLRVGVAITTEVCTPRQGALLEGGEVKQIEEGT